MNNVSSTIPNVPTARVRPITGTHMPAFVFQTGKDLARHAAQIIARLIRERSDLGQTTVLGLSTGSTPVGTYRELIRLHPRRGARFHVVSVGEFGTAQVIRRSSCHTE
ncbi:MAG: hypothetical protein U0930_10585 [Pirellulales bacterium]